MTPIGRDISVIVCAYTEVRWNELVSAVESLRSQTVAPREIIVSVDHNPTLLTRVLAELPDVIAIENVEAKGLSGARNAGLAAARGSVIAFIDDDATAAPDWLERLGGAYDDPRVLGVGGLIMPLWLSRRPEWFPEEFGWVVGCSYRGLPERAGPVRNLIGANMSFRREVFAAVGGFRQGIGRVGTLPMGCEETELSIRARRRWPESTLLFQPEARVFHRVPANRTSWSYFRSRTYSEGLSKALVSRLAGMQDGLSSERSYTFRTLPRGVARGLADALLRRQTAGIARAGAIVAGLALTTAGYIAGSVRNRTAQPAAPRVQQDLDTL